MVWAAISSRGSSELDFLEEKRNSTKYIKTLDQYLFLLCDKFRDYAVIFQHDNALYTYQNFSPAEEFESSEVASSLPRLEPIENVWGLLARSYTQITIFNMGNNIQVLRN